MCGRYALTTSAEMLVEVFHLADVPEIEPRYNVAPTQDAPVVRMRRRGANGGDEGESPAAGGPQLEVMRWGLVPFFSPDPKAGPGMINARAETAATKPAYRRALERRRCLVPADGFFEWRTFGPRTKQPYFIHRTDGLPFAFAGLWEYWKKRDDSPPDAPDQIVSFTILTTEPNDTVRPLHDRMPVVIEPSDFERWLDPDMNDAAALRPLFAPCAADTVVAYPVSRRVNTPDNDDPACLERVPDPPEPDEGSGAQQDLLFPVD